MQPIKIALIAGHSSLTAGKRTPPFIRPVDIDKDGTPDVLAGMQYKEHFANVGVSVRLDEALRRCGFQTFKIGWNDANPTDDLLADDGTGLAKRQALVRAAGCAISVSTHFNAFGYGATFNEAKGVCTFIHSTPSKCGDSKALATYVQTQLAKGTQQVNRGVLTQALAEANCLVMGTTASILVELAFMTNQYEAESLMANSAFWVESAEEICRGVCQYAKVDYVEPEDIDVKTKVISADMNGKVVQLTSIVLNDENYVRIRDLANAQTDDTFEVNWDATKEVPLKITSK